MGIAKDVIYRYDEAVGIAKEFAVGTTAGKSDDPDAKIGAMPCHAASRRAVLCRALTCRAACAWHAAHAVIENNDRTAGIAAAVGSRAGAAEQGSLRGCSRRRRRAEWLNATILEPGLEAARGR